MIDVIIRTNTDYKEEDLMTTLNSLEGNKNINITRLSKGETEQDGIYKSMCDVITFMSPGDTIDDINELNRIEDLFLQCSLNVLSTPIRINGEEISPTNNILFGKFINRNCLKMYDVDFETADGFISKLQLLCGWLANNSYAAITDLPVLGETQIKPVEDIVDTYIRGYIKVTEEVLKFIKDLDIEDNMYNNTIYESIGTLYFLFNAILNTDESKADEAMDEIKRFVLNKLNSIWNEFDVNEMLKWYNISMANSLASSGFVSNAFSKFITFTFVDFLGVVNAQEGNNER